MNENITKLNNELKKVENLMAHILTNDNKGTLNQPLTKAQNDLIYEIYRVIRDNGYSLRESNK